MRGMTKGSMKRKMAVLAQSFFNWFDDMMDRALLWGKIILQGQMARWPDDQMIRWDGRG